MGCETCSLLACIAQWSFFSKFFFQLFSFHNIFLQHFNFLFSYSFNFLVCLFFFWRTCYVGMVSSVVGVGAQKKCREFYTEKRPKKTTRPCTEKSTELYTENGERKCSEKETLSPSQGLEPWTTRLRALRSTNWARTAITNMLPGASIVAQILFISFGRNRVKADIWHFRTENGYFWVVFIYRNSRCSNLEARVFMWSMVTLMQFTIVSDAPEIQEWFFF